MQISRDQFTDTTTLLGRLNRAEEQLEKQQVLQNQLDAWLRGLYKIVGYGYPGDDPQPEGPSR